MTIFSAAFLYGSYISGNGGAGKGDAMIMYENFFSAADIIASTTFSHSSMGVFCLMDSTYGKKMNISPEVEVFNIFVICMYSEKSLWLFPYIG